MPTEFDIPAARASLASYDETCQEWSDACDAEEKGELDSGDQIEASTTYHDALSENHAHDLAHELRKALAEIERLTPAAEVELPVFPIPADVVEGDEVTCPHRDEETGEVCGATMEVQERVWDYRPTHWNEGRDGSAGVSIGGGQLGDGEFVSFECERGHAFAPDWDRFDYN